jgi:polyferredoxin
VACCQAIGVGALALIVSAGLFGNQNTFKNIAPVSVWVIWWVGFSFFCAFVGNVWGLINPWVALFDVGERLARPWAKDLSLQLPYPRWLGAWPACALLLLFAWLELVGPARDVRKPRMAVGVINCHMLRMTRSSCGKVVLRRPCGIFGTHSQLL